MRTDQIPSIYLHITPAQDRTALEGALADWYTRIITRRLQEAHLSTDQAQCVIREIICSLSTDHPP